MRRLFVATLFLSALCAVPANAEDYIDLVRKGNEAFKSGDHKKAMECYHSAETELPESPELEYNMAGALYRDGAYEEATDKYTKAMNTTNIGLEGDAHYNL
ncbi:MAG: hypothetical protein U9R56_07610, partial [candidate division Zixibacteria bacterium]|nr:hypothetical protein [candidate division Zixibacteria bacterium]